MPDGMGNKPFAGLKNLLVSQRLNEAREAVKRNELSHAVVLFRDASREAPLSSADLKLAMNATYGLSKALTAQGRFDEARRVLSEAASLSTIDPLLRERGRLASGRLGDKSAAERLVAYKRSGYFGGVPRPLRVSQFVPVAKALGVYVPRRGGDPPNPLTRDIWSFKNGDKDLGSRLGTLLGAYALTEECIVGVADIIVPVPPEPQRQRERGFNPPLVLAREVSEIAGIPMLPTVLNREPSDHARFVDEQVLYQSISADRSSLAVGKRTVVALLVDDISTSGATLRSCARRLLEIGVASVMALVLGRTQRDSG